MDIQIIQVTEKTSYFDFAGISIPFYRMGDGIVLLDSGYHYMGERIRDYLKENGLTLLGIIHSHIHIDHVSGDDAFPLDGSIPIYGCRDAIQESYEEHSKPSDQMATRVFDPADFLKLLDRFRSCLSDTGDDGRVEIGGQIFRVLEMPGHSKYHRAIITPDDVCYVGDALMYGKTLEKAKAPYTFNLVDDIRSKKEIARLDCPAFIAAHEGHFGRDRLSEVVRGNLAVFQNILDNVRKLEETEPSLENIQAQRRLLENIGIHTRKSVFWLTETVSQYFDFYKNYDGRSLMDDII